jgi:hypothetical protein
MAATSKTNVRHSEPGCRYFCSVLQVPSSPTGANALPKLASTVLRLQRLQRTRLVVSTLTDWRYAQTVFCTVE